MDAGFELTVYAIAITMTLGLAFITRSIITIDTRAKKQMHELRAAITAARGAGPEELEGEVDITHPRTGERLRARAKFRVISRVPRRPRP